MTVSKLIAKFRKHPYAALAPICWVWLKLGDLYDAVVYRDNRA